MPRIPTPRKWRDWYVTEAGGQGIHKLCPIKEGMKTAREKLSEWLNKRTEEKRKTEEDSLAEVDKPFTFRQLAGEFMSFKETTMSGKTLKGYKFYLKRTVGWYGKLEARKISMAHGVEFVAKLRKEVTSPYSINHYIQAAKAVFNHAVDNDRIAKNPWKKLPKLKEQPRKRVVTDDEFQKLLDTCEGCWRKNEREMMRDILRVLRFTALRPGEIRLLQWRHLHLDDHMIIIPASEQKTGSTTTEPADRMVPILEECLDILKRRQAKYGHQPFVFPHPAGNSWDEKVFSRKFNRLRKRAGLNEPDHNGEKIVWYSLRHTRLTEAATQEGWEFYTLMHLAGHTTPAMTKRYVHPGKEDLKRAAKEGEQRRKDRITKA